MPVEPRASAPLRRGNGRAEDTRIAELETRVAVSEQTHVAFTDGLTRLQIGVDKIDANLDRLIGSIVEEHGDLTKTPVGRDVIARLALVNGRMDREIETRIKTLETGWEAEKTFRSEIRGAVRLLRGLAVFTSVLAAVMAIAWYIELFGAKL